MNVRRFGPLASNVMRLQQAHIFCGSYWPHFRTYSFAANRSLTATYNAACMPFLGTNTPGHRPVTGRSPCGHRRVRRRALSA